MTVPIFFALVGGIILVGFLANLLFRVTKIPSVLLLMTIGVVLGPITGWVTSGLLFEIAPFFGTLALLIILFEGGLELDIMTVAKEAPRATFLAVVIFVLSFLGVACFAFYVMDMTLLNALLIAAVFGATSPAITLPVVQGLSVRDEIKTIVKLESALGDVLLIVSVILLIDVYKTGQQDSLNMLVSFVRSFAVAVLIASICGVLWSRLIGWMGKEPLAYMLTLGFMFLLYFVVEELHGSAAIAVLLFGLILENMEVLAERFSERLRVFFGINIQADKFILNQFMKNVTEEISFLVRTFFFVYLGLLMNFDSLTWEIGLAGFGMGAILLAARSLTMRVFHKRNPDLTTGELRVLTAMMPRGLTTAVMAFLPMQAFIPGTEAFVMYAFVVIVLTNVFMTVKVLTAERRLKSERVSPASSVTTSAPSSSDVVPPSQPSSEKSQSGPQSYDVVLEDEGARMDATQQRTADTIDERESSSLPLTHSTFEYSSEDCERTYIHAIRSSTLFEPLFWIQLTLAAMITTLGLLLNQSAVVIGAAVIVPFMWPVLGAGLALVSGDMYLLFKLLVKLFLAIVVTIILATFLAETLPFSEVTSEIAMRTRPTVIDFFIAFFIGIAGALLATRKEKVFEYIPGILIAIALLPSLCVIGFGAAHNLDVSIMRGGALLFIANFFATILGATVVFLFIGMSKVADNESIRQWKQHELARPLVRFIFTKLRLLTLVGKTGTVRARIIVAVLFLLAVILPLRTVLDQLGREFRVRQAVKSLEQMFNIPDRSTVLNTSSFIGERETDVRLQVATNQFFTSDDIERFEQRMLDMTGVPTRLNLVQTLSDIQRGAAQRSVLASRANPVSRNFSDLVADMRTEARSMMKEIPVPRSMELISLTVELASDTLAPVTNFLYIADAAMAEDTRDLLASMISNRVGIPKRGIHFVWHPRRFVLDDPIRGISNEEREEIRKLQQFLDRYHKVSVTLVVKQQESIERHRLVNLFRDVLPVISDSLRCRIVQSVERGNGMELLLSVAQ